MAYVFCEGIHINELMVKSGYGTVAYILKPNTLLFPQMLEIEKEAKASKIDVWSIKGYVDEEKHHYNRNDATKHPIYCNINIRTKWSFFE